MHESLKLIPIRLDVGAQLGERFSYPRALGFKLLQKLQRHRQTCQMIVQISREMFVGRIASVCLEIIWP
jgi:hypothetical protein